MGRAHGAHTQGVGRRLRTHFLFTLTALVCTTFLSTHCAVPPMNRIMLVTGASKGLGAEVSKHFAQSGWRVAALARDRKALDRVVSDVASSDRLLPIKCDISDSASVGLAIASACDHFGGTPTALINNAAVYAKKPFHEVDLDSINSLVDTNLKGAMYVTRAVLPGMLDVGRGRIIFVNSVAGLPTWTIPGESLYCATRHGLSGFADSLAHELKGSGVQVTSIHPGGIDTPLQAAAATPEDMRLKLLKPADMVSCIQHVLESDPHVLYERIEVFGSSFWH